MLEAVLMYLNNWFERNPVTRERNIYRGVLAIEGGKLSGLPDGFLAEGQRYRVLGSKFNDGLHEGGETLTDETFTGSVWALAVPDAVVELAGEVATWSAANVDVQNSPYQSESFGGYSYSLKNGNGASAASQGGTWQSVFAARLAPWRKL